jgi:ribosomal protein L40E
MEDLSLRSLVETERSLLDRILAGAMDCAQDFARKSAVSRDWQRAAADGMDWHAAYLTYPGREPRIPWIVHASHGEDQTKWRVRHRVRAQYQAAITKGAIPDVPTLGYNNRWDNNIRLEAVLNGRFILPSGDSGISGTEGPEMCARMGSLKQRGDPSIVRPSDEEIRNIWLDNYGSRTQGVLLWSATGEVHICEQRWKIQSLEECYSYSYPEGEEPLPFQADFAQIGPANTYLPGSFHLDDRMFWMTAIFFAFLRRTGYSRIDNALEILFERTLENDGRLLVCGHCGARGPNRLRRCGRCKSAWYCNQEHQRAAWPAHKRQCHA